MARSLLASRRAIPVIRAGSGARLAAVVLWCGGAVACHKPPPVSPLPSAPPPTPLAALTPIPVPVPPPTPAPTPTPPPTPTPTPTPEPTATPTPPPPVPVVVRELAPTGVLYVLKDASVRIPGGLIGVSAGDQVTLVSAHGNKLTVSNGHDEFELDKSQVTDDPKLSAQLATRARAAQAAQDLYQSRQDAIRRAQDQQSIEYLQAHPLATPRDSASP